jgi:hypothetical protein
MPQENNEKKGIDLKNILLPKKEVRTPASAERINAGVLLENEQTAELPKVQAAPIQPSQQPMGPVDDTKVKPLQTFQADIESVISQKNLSAVSIASAELTRGQNEPPATQTAGTSWVAKATLVLGGVMLLGGAAAALGFVFLRQVPSVFIAQETPSPFLAVDATTALVLKPSQQNRPTVMQNLTEIRTKPSVSVGLMVRTQVSVSSSTSGELSPSITTQELLSYLAPNASGEFLRSLDPTYYLLGTHVFDGAQAFLVVRTTSYERAFSGMLAWEYAMEQDLLPLFDRQRPPILQGTNSSTTTDASPSAFLPTKFRDKVVANHDTRVLEDAAGDIILLWTFLDRNTLVITTNELTLKEIISRRYPDTAGQ